MISTIISRIVWRMLWFLMVLSFLWACGFTYFISSVPTISEGKVDAIVVLTGGEGRIDEGIKLLKSGNAPVLFISGVGEGVTLSDIAPTLAQKWQDKIELGHKARDTEGNALEVREWALENQVTRLRIVTASYHMPRSLILLQNAMPSIILKPHPVFTARRYEERSVKQDLLLLKNLVVEYHKFAISFGKEAIK
jgi:uncharacterized SAM-binding protein YcdF (DUF218 family)